MSGNSGISRKVGEDATLTFASMNSLGGAFDLGMTQAGWELVYRCGTLNLGKDLVEANRHLLGWNWTSDFKRPPQEWETPEVDVLIGNPPCSAWSTMTRKDLRGANADVLFHTSALVDYAIRLKPKYAVVFESVQQAFTMKEGCRYMGILYDRLQQETGEAWRLYHVLHDNSGVGGGARRRRYFWTAIRGNAPFGIEHPDPDGIPTLWESIGDLAGLHETWDAQPYRVGPSWWSSRRRREDGVVDGMAAAGGLGRRRLDELIDAIGGNQNWHTNWKMEDAVKTAYEMNGSLPESWSNLQDKIVAGGFKMGINQATRWTWHKPARVLTGSALVQAVHPSEPRGFTHREAARIQGFPDTWVVSPVRNLKSLPVVWGKGVPVDAGRWIGHWLRSSLEGTPGTMTGVPMLHNDGQYIMQMDRGPTFRERARFGRRRHEAPVPVVDGLMPW